MIPDYLLELSWIGLQLISYGFRQPIDILAKYPISLLWLIHKTQLFRIWTFLLDILKGVHQIMFYISSYGLVNHQVVYIFGISTIQKHLYFCFAAETCLVFEINSGIILLYLCLMVQLLPYILIISYKLLLTIFLKPHVCRMSSDECIIH